MDWSKDWVKKITIRDNENDTKGWVPFPLQFANIYRIEKNDAVYIFDETGAGKTISTGLMAIHYLYNNPGKKVLVITIPSLIRSGQFENDWFNVLPFSDEMKDRITFTNDVYSNIRKYSNEDNKKYGLIIIDEAHRHLEAKKRKEAVTKLRAEKVIFMTATPIKRGAYNLGQYCKLAEDILNKEVDTSWIGEVKENPEKICSKFNLEYPVTRYFKDTINALKFVKDGEIDFEKKKAIRKSPEIWSYGNERIEDLFNKILEKAQNKDEDGRVNRFIIFTRYIEKEADILVEHMKKHEDRFTEFTGAKPPSGKLSYVSINGGSSSSLGAYSHNGEKKELPDILIVTYQIAEAGVNLPGYNYVVNYHIPAFPSALEQRFGRVDRMGQTMYTNIHMAFLVSDSGYIDTYKLNFFLASYMYEKCLLSYIPARNTILTKEVMEWKRKEKAKMIEQIEELESLCGAPGNIEKVYDCLCKREKNTAYAETNYGKLVEFCVDHEIAVENDAENKDTEIIADNLEALREELREEILDELNKIRKEISEKDELMKVVLYEGDMKCPYESMDDGLERLADKVFYNIFVDGIKEKKLILQTKDPIMDCAKSIYAGGYKAYAENFKEDIKKPLLISNEKKIIKGMLRQKGFTEDEIEFYDTAFLDNLIKNKISKDVGLSGSERDRCCKYICWLKKAEEYFEGQFIYSYKDEDDKDVRIGNFQYIFMDEYENLLREEIFKEEITEDIEGITEFIKEFSKKNYRESLPFFIMCKEYKRIIYERYQFITESLRENPFEQAYKELIFLNLIPDKIKMPVLRDEKGNYTGLNLNDGFYAHKIKLGNSGTIVWACGNWFKLGFHCWYSEKMYDLVKYINDPDASVEDIGKNSGGKVYIDELYRFFHTGSRDYKGRKEKRSVFRIRYGYDIVNNKYNYSIASKWIPYKPYKSEWKGYSNLYYNEVGRQRWDFWSTSIFRMLMDDSPCQGKDFGSQEWKEEFKSDKEGIRR